MPMNQANENRLSVAINKVDLPKGALVERCFPRIDYADAYQARLPAGLSVDVNSIARNIILSVPRWIRALMTLRNQIVSLIGLKTPNWDAIDSENIVFKPGLSVRGFRVFERTKDEVLLGEDDSHLDFRVSILRQAEGNGFQIVVSTVVRFNSWVGRAYFLPVKPMHKIIVRVMMREAIQALVLKEMR